MAYSITNQKGMRAAFWAENPGLQRRRIRDYSGKGLMHCTDTRVAFVDWLDAQERNGRISEDLANRATLEPAKMRKVYRIQGNYGTQHGWETENEEYTRADALRSLREYRANGPGKYRLKTGRELVQGG